MCRLSEVISGMSHTIHAFDYLSPRGTDHSASTCVLFGDEPFLKRLVRERLRQNVLGDDDIPFSIHDGESVEWRDVIDELSTLSLFGAAQQFVVVEHADRFVTQCRAQLETYTEQSQRRGVLVLEVETWAKTTRLYKRLDTAGLQVDCRAPQSSRGKQKTLDRPRLHQWLGTWAKQTHDLKLPTVAAEALVDLVGADFGRLDQELAKLALLVNQDDNLTPALVQDVVGGWKAKTTWELVDVAADGDLEDALTQLDRLLQSGEHPLALFGQIAWSLRRFATAARIYEQAERKRRRVTLQDALIQAGFPHWNRKGLSRAEQQLKQLGRQRAGQLYRWLLETDLALKGSHSAPDRARFALEQLFARLSRPLPGRQEVAPN